MDDNVTVFTPKIRFLLLSLFCVHQYSFIAYSLATCPEDSFFDEKVGKCKDCQPGYFGPNCSKPCPYPNYGTECQDECKCNQEICNHISGCIKDVQSIEESKDKDTLIIVAIVIGISLIIVTFIVISIANRRFFTRHIRQNAHYVGSIMAEHTGDTYNPHLHRTQERSETDATCTPTDNGIYMMANTLRYENVRVE